MRDGSPVNETLFSVDQSSNITTVNIDAAKMTHTEDKIYQIDIVMKNAFTWSKAADVISLLDVYETKRVK